MRKNWNEHFGTSVTDWKKLEVGKFYRFSCGCAEALGVEFPKMSKHDDSY